MRIYISNITGRKAAALAGVNVKISAGETVLLLGPSGSGKSTLALSFNGLISQKNQWPDGWSGMHLWNGYKRNLYICSDPRSWHPLAQFVTMTVEDEIAFGLENLSIPRNKMNNLIQESLDQVGMTGYRHRQLDELSGGEKQRLAIAYLLAMQPKILIFDKPTANLDPSCCYCSAYLYACDECVAFFSYHQF
ncbi:energy-coupling factor ABC transporter ATP-binding protein [Peptococcaceae bacterium]|nr:energy-coupling factor ABC transporter ATP-binding protein [Peptococcaceae bacterium]